MPLYAVMCYVGSLHHQLPQRRDLEQLALQHLQPDQFSLCDVGSKGLCQVAALLLLAIASYGQAELGKASDLLERAISLSVDIGMNRVDLAESLRDKELGELWKRTYWYLYIVESAVAGTEGEFRFEPMSTFPLPCEKDGSQQITLAQFDTADFEDDFHVFSSLTYLIALVRIGRSIKRLCERSKDHPARTVVWADALLMNWKLHLPSDKQQVFTENGEIDDVMFQAHILFHRKLEAAEGAVSLLTLHPCLVQMSPLNITPLSGIAMSTICASLVIEPDSQTRDNLRLILGVFKQLGETWKAAKQEAQTLKAMARLSYSELSNPPQEIIVGPQIGPKDASGGGTGCLFPDIMSPVQDSDLGSTPPDARRSSLTMPFSEDVAGSSADAYIFSWDF
ncbi:hypothetical protein EKO27_g7160 [Xylaria grammica]|uniref:Xylanolytic transcriptional activator regulatory domain-containing protein n=1 Tax=Xylaria grammica TaxID=363999 RepID=A0A439D0Y7_9PEZI|nr:hypothetical protein EKO27_g7160 [Xylaria grammica]